MVFARRLRQHLLDGSPSRSRAPTTPPAPAVNPFQGARFYVDPEFAKMVAKATAPTPEDGARLKKVAAFPTAVWLESLETAKLAGADAGRRAASRRPAGGGPVVPVFVVYNLPNRDCAAEGSRGELFVDKGGEALYQSQFIDVIAAAFAAHPSQKIAVILEPDSLPNLVTNIELPTCAAAEQIYRRGVAYAISKLSMPNVFIYLDAAHAGWLGWPKNLPKAVTLFKEVLAHGGRRRPHPRLRGERVELRPAARAEREEERPRRPEPGRARLRRRPRRGPRQGRHHRQGLHHRHQPQRQGEHPQRRRATGATSRAPASASARRPRPRRTSTPTSG